MRGLIFSLKTAMIECKETLMNQNPHQCPFSCLRVASRLPAFGGLSQKGTDARSPQTVLGKKIGI
jgi:hypothetical protein